MNVNLEVLLRECLARRLSVDDVMGALASAMIVPRDIAVDYGPLLARTPARPADQAATETATSENRAARAAPPVAPPPPMAAPAPATFRAVRVLDAVLAGSPYADTGGANWRDATGAWFDPAAHAWNRNGYPSVTPAGHFRAKRAGSAAPIPRAETKAPPAETTGGAGETVTLNDGELLDLSLQLKECSEVHGLNELDLFETHFETLFEDWITGNQAQADAYREVEIAIDAKRQELTERLSDADGQGHPPA